MVIETRETVKDHINDEPEKSNRKLGFHPRSNRNPKVNNKSLLDLHSDIIVITYLGVFFWFCVWIKNRSF